MAGALTPTEVITAWEAGRTSSNIPVWQVGGANYIKALKGPLPQVRLVPTGGVNLNTAAEFIEAGAAALASAENWCSRGSEVKQAGNHRRKCQEIPGDREASPGSNGIIGHRCQEQSLK